MKQVTAKEYHDDVSITGKDLNVGSLQRSFRVNWIATRLKEILKTQQQDLLNRYTRKQLL